MKKVFSNNNCESFFKTIFHYVPNVLSYVNKIRDSRKTKKYSMGYLKGKSSLMIFDRHANLKYKFSDICESLSLN